MIGSTILFEKDPTRLASLVSSLDHIDDFVHLDLDVMITLDFASIVEAGDVRWVADKPVVFDEEDALATMKIDPRGIAFVLNQELPKTPKHESDLQRLAAFVAEHGDQHLYELATF